MARNSSLESCSCWTLFCSSRILWAVILPAFKLVDIAEADGIVLQYSDATNTVLYDGASAVCESIPTMSQSTLLGWVEICRSVKCRPLIYSSRCMYLIHFPMTHTERWTLIFFCVSFTRDTYRRHHWGYTRSIGHLVENSTIVSWGSTYWGPSPTRNSSVSRWWVYFLKWLSMRVEAKVGCRNNILCVSWWHVAVSTSNVSSLLMKHVGRILLVINVLQVVQTNVVSMIYLLSKVTQLMGS